MATGYEKTVEVINLDPANPDLICDNLPEFPISISAGTGQLFNKNMPIICGGYYQGNDYSDCYAFQDQSWIKISSLNEGRRYPASALVSLEQEKEVLMITGGFDLGTVLKSVESFDGTDWEQGQLSVLPRGVLEHCLVKINSTTLLLVGGAEFNGNSNPGSTTHVSATYFYDVNENQWSPGPALNEARAGAGCGILNWMNPQTNQMEKIVVAAGGQNSLTTELLYVDRIGDYSWNMGPTLPTETGFPSMVEFQNSVILIGGLVDPDSSIAITDLFQLSSPGVYIIKLFLCQ